MIARSSIQGKAVTRPVAIRVRPSGISRVLAAVGRGARAVGSAFGRWASGGYVGPDDEREIGRHTGARC
jgi:hypothetical protein